MPVPRSTVIPLTATLLCACAATPPAVTPQAALALPMVRAVQVDGPALSLDWAATFSGFAQIPADPRNVAEIEAVVAEAYRWSEWREVLAVAAPEPDASGVLHVSVSADAPLPGTPAPAAMARVPDDVVPAPAAVGGARAESTLDAALSAWQQSPARVLIDGAERRLYLKRRNGTVVSYPVAVGSARTPTPAGDYIVEAVRQKPTWYPPASIRREHAAKGELLPASIPPGPRNPLGEWFVRLQNGIGIHGTNQPRSIGRAASHGCVRMHDSDVAELVGELARGDGVTVVRKRSALVAGTEGTGTP